MPKFAGAWWPVGWRCVAVFGLLAVLAGLAYETGRPGAAGPAFSRQVQYVITTLTKPAVAIPLATVIVIALASLLRRLRFEWLVFKPGPIFVQELVVAPGVTDIDVAHLTTRFRGRLMQLRLHAPTPVPGASPADDFLSVLDASHLDSSNWLGSAISVLRAAIPTHGYEVSVTLTQESATGPGKPRVGVTAQLTRLPNEGVPIETAWAHSWDDAIVRAADMVTAAVLPRTRLSNRAPWSGWRRYVMPGLVVHSYERAQELTSERRYDEALSHCFKALELDPKSVDLRLCKGFIEEKLGLYMDAVATYASARRLADNTSNRLYNRKAIRNRQVSGRIASYRLAVLLGGIKFTHQWCKPDGDTRRGRQRCRLRTRLSPELQTLLERHKLLPRKHTTKRTEILELLDTAGTGKLKDTINPRYYALRELFAQLADRELSKLQRSLRWRRTPPGSLTPLSVELTGAATRLRLDYARYRAAALRAAGSTRPNQRPDWKPDPKIDGRGAERPFKTWTEEYSAAILFALPLLDDAGRLPSERRSAFEEKAVTHLKRAMSSTPSWHAAEQRDWVLNEDPDLDGLRESLPFKHFEATFFPSPSPTPLRPRGASRWEMSRYTNLLLADSARRWEKVWHQRREMVVAKVDPHLLIQWSKDEAKAWQAVERMARDYKHWPARCELIDAMREWSATYGFEPLTVALPRFVRDTDVVRDAEGNHDEEVAYAELATAIATEMAANTTRLGDLVGRLEPITGSNSNGAVATVPHTREYRLWSWLASSRRAGEPPVKQFERLQDELSNRDFWHRAAPVQFLESVCDVHAAMWQRLHEWLEEPADRHTHADGGFQCAIAQAARLSDTSGGRWVTAVVARRIQRLGSADADGHESVNGARAARA